jgi:hypothetical protein
VQVAAEAARKGNHRFAQELREHRRVQNMRTADAMAQGKAGGVRYGRALMTPPVVVRCIVRMPTPVRPGDCCHPGRQQHRHPERVASTGTTLRSHAFSAPQPRRSQQSRRGQRNPNHTWDGAPSSQSLVKEN